MFPRFHFKFYITAEYFNRNIPVIYSFHETEGIGLTCVAKAGLPAEQQTPRLSPQLAIMMYFSVIRAQTAVVPDLSSPLATFRQSFKTSALI
jgi:hypothetical protein